MRSDPYLALLWPQNEFAAKLASVLLPLAIGFLVQAFLPALRLQYWLRLPIYIQKSCAQAAVLRRDELRSCGQLDWSSAAKWRRLQRYEPY